METTLAIFGLALGVASLIPAFTTKGRRQKIIFVAIGLPVVGIFAFQIFGVFRHRAEMRATEQEIVDQLTAKGPMTWDQLLLDMFYPDYSEADDAMDALVAAKKVKQEVVTMQSSTGTIHGIRSLRRIDPA